MKFEDHKDSNLWNWSVEVQLLLLWFYEQNCCVLSKQAGEQTTVSNYSLGVYYYYSGKKMPIFSVVLVAKYIVPFLNKSLLSQKKICQNCLLFNK